MEHILDGTDLILSVGGGALAFSTGCKITTQTETGERVTKEAASGKWKEKYVKSYSESISADGVVCTDGTTDAPTYDQLKDMQISGTPVDVAYNVREAGSRSGKTAGGYMVSLLSPRWTSTPRQATTRSTPSSWRTVARWRNRQQVCRRRPQRGTLPTRVIKT